MDLFILSSSDWKICLFLYTKLTETLNFHNQSAHNTITYIPCLSMCIDLIWFHSKESQHKNDIWLLSLSLSLYLINLCATLTFSFVISLLLLLLSALIIVVSVCVCVSFFLSFLWLSDHHWSYSIRMPI